MVRERSNMRHQGVEWASGCGSTAINNIVICYLCPQWHHKDLRGVFGKYFGQQAKRKKEALLLTLDTHSVTKNQTFVSWLCVIWELLWVFLRSLIQIHTKQSFSGWLDTCTSHTPHFCSLLCKTRGYQNTAPHWTQIWNSMFSKKGDVIHN